MAQREQRLTPKRAPHEAVPDIRPPEASGVMTFSFSWQLNLSSRGGFSCTIARDCTKNSILSIAVPPTAG
jgi:hypothetical protein